jgi:hypothetical protein
MNLLGADLLRQSRELALGLALSDYQARTPLAQLGVEVLQALEQELRPRSGFVAPVQQSLVEAEDGDDTPVRIQSRP